MTSLLNRLTSFTNPSKSGDSTSGLKSRPDGFQTATTSSALFAPTDPAIDGDECLHDCASCSIQYPRKFAIDEDEKLYGEIKGWNRHLLVATGKTDWVRDVEEEKGSVMEAVGKHAGLVEGGRLMLSASNIPPPEWEGEGEGVYAKGRPTRCLLLPAFQWVEGVLPENVPEVIKGVVNPAATNLDRLGEISAASSGEAARDQNLSGQVPAPTLPPGITLHACPHKYLILLCSQATRDARCGQSAPLLRRELERHLRPLGLFRDFDDTRPGGVGIYFISHVGGHKYSANMMVYRRDDGGGRSVEEQMQANGDGQQDGQQGQQAGQCIWLARVRPEDCENIVRFTVLQGKVVKPERQLRGGFDRGRGVVSW
ncbi:sucrase/ferredoxin-like family protein [Hortaea werneckii]|nr:sucrase/ferredoxin-like family protein [Hortaea werneckii]KAI6806749.1 sucrase/ferredoxin-like family protein [Hortaea werneckii]KAI6908486.1 sucrase/ferredoxin-like family protein [Hortaea werneckii]KAI6925278.1 sucrase/ferredoxin-like family protein [Hortaea werneckii]KAI6958973.1 sucrase/ferredoxin-like family protein [Hortaea werneckii]